MYFTATSTYYYGEEKHTVSYIIILQMPAKHKRCLLCICSDISSIGCTARGQVPWLTIAM